MELAPITVPVRFEFVQQSGTLGLKLHTDTAGAVGDLAAPEAGYLFEGRVARVHHPGDPLTYWWGNEHRDAEELQRIVEQLPGKPVAAPPDKAYGHPIDLIKVGAPHKVVGRMLSARIDGDHAVAQIFITDAETIKAIREDGIEELSLGYGCRTDEVGYQRGTYVDHLAVVPRARCGGSCALRNDSQDERPTEERMRTDHAGTCTCQMKQDAKLNASARHALPSGDFADPKTKQEPLEDEGHVRAAMSRFEQTHFPSPEEKRAAFHRILGAAKKFGIDASGFEKAHHMDAPGAAPGESPCACRIHAVNSPGEPMADNEAPKMDEFQKKIAEVTAESAAQKVRADQEKARADAAEQSKKDADKRAETLEGERDAARADATAQKTRADAAEQAKKDAETQARQDAAAHLDAAVSEKLGLLVKATEILGSNDTEGKPVDRSKLSPREIKVAVIKHVDGIDVPAEKSDDYVQARYDGALEHASVADASHAAARQATQKTREGAQTRNDADDESASVAAMHENYRKSAKKA